MKVTEIPVVIGVLGLITTELVRGQEEVEIGCLFVCLGFMAYQPLYVI